MVIRVGILFLYWLSSPVWAATVLKSTFSHDVETDQYSLFAEIEIAAPRTLVLATLTDYKNLSKVSPLITESTVLKEYSPQHHQIRLISSQCILFFCADSIRTQDIRIINEHRIEATIIPEQSNFKQASSVWTLTTKNTATVIQYETHSVPDFWIPPVIGPWFLESAMQDSIIEMAEGIERIARQKAQP